MDLEIRVVRISGKCPVYKEGDRFVLESGYVIHPEDSCAICMHSLASIIPYYTALSHGIEPVRLGLSPKRGKPAHVQCLDPCAYTGGGTVEFEIKAKER